MVQHCVGGVKRGLGIITQSLLVADGAEKQMERPDRWRAITESAMADEALIQPAELGRNFAEAMWNEELFVNHLWDAISGTAGAADRAPQLRVRGCDGRCPLATSSPGFER